MKKCLLLPFIALMFCRANATSVDLQTATRVALNFYAVTTSLNATNITATLKYTHTASRNAVDFYVFDIAPAPGFVIVAANDNTIPVLGYSTETNFSLPASNTTGIYYWMNHVSMRMHKSMLLNVTADSRIAGLWHAYLNGENPNATRSGSVNPLLTTTWDQEPYYNALCPYNTTDQQRAVTGCVATAMAQIMKYWAYPTRGKGSYTYVDSMPAFSNNYGRQSANFDTVFNWAQMPASISSANNAIALLMYDCGVSVGMDYGDDNQGGSGAWVLQSEAGAGNPCSQYAYANYFYYNPYTLQGIIKSNYAQTEFISLIENELNNNRVVQYEGDDTNGAGGHTWVCDGYDASNELHMNWGWSGQNDGYFAVTNLDAGMYNFDDHEAALIGIEPISPVNVTVQAASQAICPGTITTLSAQGPASATFSWIPTDGLSCPTCASTTVSPTSNAIYTVTADSGGVKGSASVAINIIQPVTANFSANTTADCSIPASIPFSNLSNNGSSYLWDFGDGTTDTAANPVHIYNSYGAYNVKLSSYNNCGADSVLHSQAVQITDQAPLITGQSICSGNSTILNAAGAGSIQWYDAPNGGNLLNTGATFTTPVLTANATYYVYSVIAPAANKAGPADSTLGAGGYFAGTNEHGLFFNCTVPQTLISVDVYAQNAGYRTINLEDSNGTVINTLSINIAAGKSTIALNLWLPAENGLKLAVTGNDNLFRNNSGASYPYASSDGTVSITNSDAGTPGYYYFFYNWKLQQPGCTTTTTVVPVTVIGGSNRSMNETANGTNVTFDAWPGITSCSRNFGDGTNSNQLNVTHNYSAPGNYTVVMIESNGTCTDTVTQSISLYPAGINGLNNITQLSLFPDPAQNQLNINITTDSYNTKWELTVYNTLGQAELQHTLQLQNGGNTFSLDISMLTAGIHILSFQNGNSVVNRRFIKSN